MKTTNSYNIFTKYFPHLDIHGETCDTVGLIIKDFINDNIKLKNKTVVIVHGKGSGILKDKTHKLLTSDKKVLNFKLDIFNLGCTIVELNIDK